MLAEMTPEEFEERWAADLLDPIDDSNRQTGEICSTIINTGIITNAENVNESDLTRAEDFIPLPAFIKRPEKTSANPELTAERSAMRYGPTRKP